MASFTDFLATSRTAWTDLLPPTPTPKMTSHQPEEALTRLARGETQADMWPDPINVGATTIGRLQAAA